MNQSVDYAATSRLTLGATARYVAKSYLDNTNNDAFVAPLLRDAARLMGESAEVTAAS